MSALESKHVAVEGGLSTVLQWDTKRGRDFQNIAYLVCCCDGLPDIEQIPTAQKMEKWLMRVDKPTDSFKAEIEELLRDFWNIASNPQLNSGLKNIGNRLAPVEFIFIGQVSLISPNESRRTDFGHQVFCYMCSETDLLNKELKLYPLFVRLFAPNTKTSETTASLQNACGASSGSWRWTPLQHSSVVLARTEKERNGRSLMTTRMASTDQCQLQALARQSKHAQDIEDI